MEQFPTREIKADPFDQLASDIWISIVMFLSYYDLINIKLVSKKSMITISTELVLKHWLKIYHPFYFYKEYNFKSIKNTVSTRWLHAKKIINILYSLEGPNLDIRVFGGFIRDYEARTREFSDIDIWINDKTNMQIIVFSLEKNGYQVSTISNNTSKTIKYADGFAQHYKLQVTNKTLSNVIILDITTNCMFDQIARDYDINSLYITSPGFLNVDFAKKSDHPVPFKRPVKYRLRGTFCLCFREEDIDNDCYNCGIKFIVTMCRKKLFNSAKNQLFNKKEDIETRHKKMLDMGFTFNYGKKLKWYSTD